MESICRAGTIEKLKTALQVVWKLWIGEWQSSDIEERQLSKSDWINYDRKDKTSSTMDGQFNTGLYSTNKLTVEVTMWP
jgi:hypothetical protein